MNLRKLSPTMLLALGLACGDDKNNDGSDTAVDACLSPPIEETEAGPCLGMEPTTDDTLDDGTSVGPCLSPPEPETSTTSTGGTSSGSGSGTDSGGTSSGSDSGGPADSGGGGMEAPPRSRDDALRRVMDNLPADVAARLKTKGGA